MRVHVHMSVYVLTRVCMEGMSMTNLTSHSLFLYKELLHFCMLAEVPVLAFMANYVEKKKSIKASCMCIQKESSEITILG